jgi:hypothetical protein
MFYGFLADVVVAFHFAYVSYVLLGELAILIGIAFKWQWIRNPWFRWTHLAAIGIVAAEAVLGVPCPLTEWENGLRLLAGETITGDSFIGALINNLMFFDVSEEVLTGCYIGFALLVLGTLWLAPPRRRPRPVTLEADKPNQSGSPVATGI